MEYETAVVKSEDPRLGDTLRAMVPVDEAGNRILTKVMAFPYGDRAILVQIYSTMITEIFPDAIRLSGNP